MLTINYCGHFVVFLGFALAQNLWLLYAFYLGYNFLFTFSIGTTTYLMWTNGEVGAPLYGIYLWVTFGNGFRYGARSLYASQVLSLIGFGSVVAFNPKSRAARD